MVTANVLVRGTVRATRVLTVAVMTTMVAVASGCDVVTQRGEGSVTSETRAAQTYSRVDVTNGIRVVIRIGPSQPIEIRAQGNLLPIIATDVDGDTLKIHSTRSFTTSEPIEVILSTPTLAAISISGGSPGQIEGLATGKLEVTASGGATLSARGSVDRLELTASGGSRSNLGDLAVKTVAVQLSGGATAVVRASDEITGSASGGARISVLGDAVINVTASGGAEVSR